MKICLKTRDKIHTFDFEDVMWDTKTKELSFFSIYGGDVFAKEIVNEPSAHKIVDTIGKCLITNCQYLQIIILASGEVLV